MVDNEATTTLVNATAKTVDVTVPTNKRWWLIGGKIENGDDVARNCFVDIRNSAQRIFRYFYDALGAAAEGNFPNTEAELIKATPTAPIILRPTDIVRFNWASGGASAGGAARYSIAVIEIDV